MFDRVSGPAMGIEDAALAAGGESAPEGDRRGDAFSIGERLDFKVYFEFILGGDASMSVLAPENAREGRGYRLVSEAHSTKTVDRFYKVRDRVESLCEMGGGWTQRYEKHLREGKYRDDKRVEYFPERGEAQLYRGGRDMPETLAVAGRVFDVLGAFYAVRRMDLEVGRSVFLDLHDVTKRYDLEVKVLRRETVEVPAGRFDCLVIQPELLSSGLFRKEGQMQIWLTNDRYKIPVLMQSRLYFGNVWSKLVGFRRGGG
jgi:hypothetical protein